jgi:methyl-accepting chemotaxis protein
MKIKHLGTMLIGLLLLVSALFAIALAHVTSRFDGSMAHLQRSYDEVAVPLEQMDANTKNLRFHLYAAFMHDTRQAVAQYHTHPLDAHTSTIKAALDDNSRIWDSLLHGSDQRAPGTDLRSLKRIYDAYYTKGIAPGIQAVETQDWDTIVRTMTGSLSEYGAFEKAMREQLRALREANEARATADRVQQRRLLIGLGVAAAVALLASFVIAWKTVVGMSRRMATVISATGAMAQGNLSFDSDGAGGRDETAEVMRAVARMQKQLSGIIGTVRDSAESVATASAQIAQGNQDLSVRTEEQASTLQTTVSTMDHFGQIVRNNAENASVASDLAQSASAIATQGGDVVQQVVSTMRDISDSSRRIEAIIGVIDGIAFQTNILALNAAVEAARAGDQGRGFSVVAAEVRTLARRSAEAAKEIKGLIGRSAEQVESGTTLVDKAGRTMREIVASSERVRNVVAEITASSVEQSSGLQQVGGSLSNMDHSTQQNAALVEQSAAAAESLRAQAQQLVAAVSIFKLAAVKAREERTDAASQVGTAEPEVVAKSARGAPSTRNQRDSLSVPRQQVSSSAHPAPEIVDAQGWQTF